MAKEHKANKLLNSFQANDATLQGLLGYHLKRSFNVVQADLARTLKPLDLRMLTYTALVFVVDNPGLSQSQLAEAMDIERPNLVVIVDELEQRGLIVRDRVPTDRRAYALRATLKGRQLFERAVKAVHDHEDALFNGIDPDTRDQIVAVLRQVQRLGSKGKT